MAILNFPDNPVGGDIFVATNGITYTYDASTTPGVWRATVTAALAVTPGSISGDPIVGATLTYTPGTPAGGTPPYTVTQVWKVDGVATASTGTTFVVPAGSEGKSITVTVTAQDSASIPATATATTAPVVILSAVTVTAGSIAAVTPVVGTSITFTPGVASGGTGSYTITYLWQADGGAVAGSPSNTTTYTPAAGDIGKVLTVVTTATDQTYPTLTANATTAPSAAVVPANIPTSTWSPTPNLNSSAEGNSSGQWQGSVPVTLTASGCVEVSLDGTNFFPTVTVNTASTVVYQRWKPTCVAQKSGDTITGSVDAGAQGSNNYSIQLDHTPSNNYNPITSSNVALGATVSQVSSSGLNGVNAPAYVTIASSGNTGTNIQAAIAAAGPWTTLATTGTGFQLLTGQTLYIRQTVGTSTTTGYVANIQVGDDPAVASPTFSTFTYTATTTSSAALPTGVYGPTAGEPNATPAGTNIGAESLVGTSSAGWNGTEASTVLTPESGKLLINKNGGTPGAAAVTLTNSGTDTVDVAFDPNYIGPLNDGDTATANFTTTYLGVNYTNVFSYIVDKNPTWAVPAPVTNAATSTQQTTGPLTITDFNSPVVVSFANPTTGTSLPMGTVQAIVGGVTTPITIGTTTVTVNPGQTLEVLGDTLGAAGQQYGVEITIGAAAAQDWLVTTSAVPNAITTPTAGPSGGPLNPTANTPSGITLTGTAYSAASGTPGPHTDTDWELWEGGFPLTSTNTISGVTTGGSGTWAGGAVAGFTAVWGIAFNGTDTLVIVGDAGGGAGAVAKYSTDGGSTWNATTGFPAGSNPAFCVGYGSGKFIARSGNSSQLVTSNDGINWTTTAVSFTPRNIHYLNGNWYAVSSSDGIWRSTDNGANWTQVLNSANLYNVAYSAGLNKFVAVGNGTIASFNTTYSSTDGVTWTPASNGVTWSQAIGVAASDTAFVAVGGGVWRSTDGINWTGPVAGTSTGVANNLAYGGGVFAYAAGATVAGNYQYSTDDGVTWTNLTTPSGQVNAVGSVYAYGEIYFSSWQTGAGVYSLSGVIANTLTIAGCQTDGFVVGDSVVSDPGAAASGTITAVDNSNVTVSPPDANWAIGQNIKRDPASYTNIVNVTDDTSNLVSYFVPEASLSTSSTYYARVRYGASSTSTESNWSNYATFTTVSSFGPPAPGTAMGGGYFAGQILVGTGEDGGGLPASPTLYNLIVAPVLGDTSGPNPAGTLQGQYGGSSPTGIAYKTTNTADVPSATAQNEVYGKPATDAFNDAQHPIFQWCNGSFSGNQGPNSGGGIGGFTDWYVPAKNELAVLYFFLKPTTGTNSISSGSNPNSVAPYTPNTNYGPGFPNQTSADGTGGTANFRTGGSQTLSGLPDVRTATQYSGNTADTWRMQFGAGFQNSGSPKTGAYGVRAIRRVAA